MNGRVQKRTFPYAARPTTLLTILSNAALLASGVMAADVILLDEQWTAELMNNEVKVTPVDTRTTGEATQAHDGYHSVLLSNEKGWPNVRFRGAQSLALGDVVPLRSQLRLWYRTNAWSGRWQVELWVYNGATGKLDKVLECQLDGGGDGGSLIADDRWHAASGTLGKTVAYDSMPKNERLPLFVWLVPKAGWNQPHRTFVDRIEIVEAGMVRSGRPSVQPAVAVRGRPGVQIDGGSWIWWEAEDALEHNFPSGGAFAPANRQEQDKLSNGTWLQHHRGAGLRAMWQVDIAKDGKFAFWTRKFWKHGPFQWRWNRGRWQMCGPDAALADDVSIRQHVNANWVYLGEVDLPRGKNVLEIEVLANASAAAFDCWLLTQSPFLPNGALKPGSKYHRAEEGWFAFEPDSDAFRGDAVLDLRGLNQQRAGEAGFVRARGMDFVFEKSSEPVRFWGVNASCEIDDPISVRYLARRLAKLGVNLVRVHGPIWDASAERLTVIDRRRLDQLHYFVKAMADEGIYTKLSFYFPLWVSMKDSYGFPGYKPGEHPFALLFFHPQFQEIYRSWARALMTTPNPYTGKPLAEDPAVAILEIVNEDNFFFWTFSPGKNPPSAAMRPLEEAFGKWLAAKYGSLDRAVEAWGGNAKAPSGDDFAAGRAALYGAGTLTSQDWAKSSRNGKRAGDQLQFLTEHLRKFYADAVVFLRGDLKVKCAISATNWRTADQRTLGALDKYTNFVCDVMDRHAYLEPRHEGEGANYSLRVGQTYVDTTGMHGPLSLTRELQYVGHPHIISEYNHPMPNRFRAEVPWLAATYGRLNGTDAYFHFALGQADWLRSHTKFSIDSPVVLGQFPATAIIFRKGYVKEGPVVSHSAVRLADLYAFQGTPTAEEQNLDSLRQADVPANRSQRQDTAPSVDPLAYYVGQVTMDVGENPGKSTAMDLTPFISRENSVVLSATSELVWSWNRGIVALNATHAQGACGFLGGVPSVSLKDMTIKSTNEYGTVLLVALDDQPLATSQRMLLQVMTEDRNYGWETQPAEADAIVKQRITNLGSPPIVVRQVAGSIALKRADAAKLRVTALDFNGYERQELGSAAEVRLLPDCLYYVIRK